MIFELDPMLSPGEIAIRIPGLPIFFEESYHTAELAAAAWCWWLLRWRPAAIECGSFDAVLDAGWER